MKYERNGVVPEQESAAQKALGDIAPKMVELTDSVLFGDVWERPELSSRDRSLITVTTLAALYRTEQLGFHVRLAMENGLSREELAEALTHLAFYAGWPNAMSALSQLKDIAGSSDASAG
ncbi:carboxymuconolactone decarboxylase family protein [Streptomyces phaeochromogenes]|uniref:carboxymuconolactone decarboxylase family protein n=1 Tax=Streptomyces phaeochromogenes TaxID=1923 RepID=UPI0036A33199